MKIHTLHVNSSVKIYLCATIKPPSHQLSMLFHHALTIIKIICTLTFLGLQLQLADLVGAICIQEDVRDFKMVLKFCSGLISL